MNSLVTTEWLERELGASDLRIIDDSMCGSGESRSETSSIEKNTAPGICSASATAAASS